VLALGKAAVSMSAAATQILGDEVEGLALTRYGHIGTVSLPPSVEVIEAGHPVPDQNGERAAARIFDLAKGLTENDRCIVLISGGGSALCALPGHGVTLADKRALAKRLLASGASVREINCVRKHLSACKGGRLALAAAPSIVETYCISDVAGDDPAHIASGPTVPDTTSQSDAMAILHKYKVAASDAVYAALNDPRNALPAKDHPAFVAGNVSVVARSRDALDAAARFVANRGYKPIVLGGDIEGEAREVGLAHAGRALELSKSSQRYALISGGECTVTLQDRAGRGGPNLEYLLALALALRGAPGVSALAADTDGIDGNSEAAGAFIDCSTLARAQDIGLDLRQMLERNASYSAFAELGDLLITGPTLTNVNDLRVILIDGEIT